MARSWGPPRTCLPSSSKVCQWIIERTSSRSAYCSTSWRPVVVPSRAPARSPWPRAFLRDTPPPISEIKQDLPRHFGRIIETCLEKDPERRYQSAKELRNALQSLQRETESGLSSSIHSELGDPAPSHRRPEAFPALRDCWHHRRRHCNRAWSPLSCSCAPRDSWVAPPRRRRQPEAGLRGSGSLLEQSRKYSQEGATLAKLEARRTDTCAGPSKLEPDNAYLQAETGTPAGRDARRVSTGRAA